MADKIKVKGFEQTGTSASDFQQFIIDSITPDLTSSRRKWLQGVTGNMSQAITKMLNGEGKPTASLVYNDLPVQHASSGKMGTKSSITFFYVVGTANAAIRILAIGGHVTSTEYNLEWLDNAWPGTGKKVNL